MAEVDAGAVAPVVPVVPASTDAPEIISTAETIEEAEDKPVAPQRAKFDEEQQKEVDRIVSKRVAQAERHALKVARAEAERDLYKRQLEDARRPQDAAPKDGEPQPTDPKFKGDYEEYLLAKAEWRIEQKQAKKHETQQRETATQQQDREEAQIASHVQKNVYAKGVEKYADFDDVAMGENVPISKPMAAFIADSPVGSDIWYELGKNDAEAQRIAGLSPAGQFRALVTLESKLTAPPRPTNTPAPIVPGKANAGGAKSLSDLIGGSQEDFEKRRNERLKAQRARK